MWRTVAACGVPARAAVSCVQLYWLRAVSLHPACCLPAPPACRAVVAALRALGLRSVLLTGDNRRTAAAIAAQLGIEEVAAEVMPAGKVAKIKVGCCLGGWLACRMSDGCWAVGGVPCAGVQSWLLCQGATC